MKRIIRFRRSMAVLLCLVMIGCICPNGRAYGSEISAKAYLVMEADYGQITAQKNAHEPLPIASTTKIMTAYITLQQQDLYEEFSVDPNAIRVEGTSMGLVEGDTVTLYGLACGMLLASGNDAANAAAVRIGGSIEQFAMLMNEQAAELGMKDTHFVNPSGLPDEEHYSTAYDMALLAAAALKNPLFREICASGQMTVEVSGQSRRYSNHNRLLSEYEGCIGVKTGYTKKAGRCLVSAALRENVTLICVTLSAPDDWNDHRKLLDAGFASVEQVILRPQQAMPDIAVVGGVSDQTDGYVLGEKKVCLTEEQAKEIVEEIRLRKFYYAPVYAGAVLGEVRYHYRGEQIASLPILCGTDVAYRMKGPQE